MNKYDPKTARDMFVTEKKGVNEIARFFNVSASTISERSRREDWKGQQMAYESAIARRSYESMAAGVADERSAITRENVLAARATVRKYLADLSAGNIPVGPRDAILMMEFLAAQPDSDPGLKHDGPMKNVTPPDAGLMQEIIKRAREKVAPNPTATEGLKVH